MSNPNSAHNNLNHTVRMKLSRMGPYSKEIILAGLEKESAVKLLAFIEQNNMYAIVKHVGLDPPEGKRISSYKKTMIKYLTSYVQDEQAAAAANDAALAAAVAKNSMVPASTTNTAAAAIDAAAGGGAAAVGVLATNVVAPNMVPVTPNARTGAGGYATPNVGVGLQYAIETTNKAVESLAVSTGNVHKLAESNNKDLNRLTGIVENMSGKIGEHTVVLGEHTVVLGEHTAELGEQNGRIKGLEGSNRQLFSRNDRLEGRLAEVEQRLDDMTPKKANDSTPKKGSTITPKKVMIESPKKAPSSIRRNAFTPKKVKFESPKKKAPSSIRRNDVTPSVKFAPKKAPSSILRNGKKNDGSIIDKENVSKQAIDNEPKRKELRSRSKLCETCFRNKDESTQWYCFAQWCANFTQLH